MSYLIVDTRWLIAQNSGVSGGTERHRLRDDWPRARIPALANAPGALVAFRPECAGAMPTVDEIESGPAQRGGRVA
jgi:hypothetical protein